MKKQLIFVGVIFFVISVAARLLPHLPNFVPVAALALFAGVYLPKRWSLILPLAAMLLSDLVIGFYEPQVMIAVYGSFALTVGIGLIIRKYGKENAALLFAGSIFNSVLFFLITNWAVWQFTQMYVHNWGGLIQSYAMGLPFLKWGLVGDLAWTFAFFGGYALVTRFFPAAKLVDNSNNQELAAQKA